MNETVAMQTITKSDVSTDSKKHAYKVGQFEGPIDIGRSGE